MNKKSEHGEITKTELIRRNSDGKVVGNLLTFSDGYKIYKQRKSYAIHAIHEPKDAWAFDQAIIGRLHQRAVDEIEVFDKDTGATYTAPLIRVIAKGYYTERGHSPQTALNFEDWDCDKETANRYRQEGLFV